MRNNELLQVIGTAIANRDVMDDATIVNLSESLLRANRPELVRIYPDPKPEGDNQRENERTSP